MTFIAQLEKSLVSSADGITGDCEREKKNCLNKLDNIGEKSSIIIKGKMNLDYHNSQSDRVR